MSYHGLAIIGTAGRGKDRDLLTRAHYTRMYDACCKLIDHLWIDQQALTLFSGGAAWADHLVVSLALQGKVRPDQVVIYLPAHLSYYGYHGTTATARKTAQTCNHYHQQFSQVVGFDSVAQLNKLGELGAGLVPGHGSFFARNTLVAQAVSPGGVLLAFTVGRDDSDQQPWSMRRFSGSVSGYAAGLKDGGTADTWSKCLEASWKFHARLGPADYRHNNQLSYS